MKKKFIYTFKFGEKYLFETSDFQIAILLAAFLKKNPEGEDGAEFYDIYFDGILIARF